MQKRNFTAIILGHLLEFYDYSLFGHLSVVFTKIFFPNTEASLALIYSFGIFASGYIARPLGAIVFGHIGDKISRKASLLISIIIMSLATILTCFLPTYQHVGALAPLLLMLTRILQGFALGGEGAGVMTLLLECNSHSKRRGLISGSIEIALAGGMLLSSLVLLIVNLNCSEAFFLSWGWRIPFLIGSFFIFIAIYLRSRLPGSLPHVQGEGVPFINLIKNHKQKILTIIGIYFIGIVPFSLLNIFIAAKLAVNSGAYYLTFLAVSLNMIVISITAPISGLISDYVGRKLVLICVGLCFIILAFPIFAIIEYSQTELPRILSCLVMAFLCGSFLGVLPVSIIETFPSTVRYSGAAISMGLGDILANSLTPILVGSLIRASGYPLAGAAYMVCFVTIGLILIRNFKDKYKETKI